MSRSSNIFTRLAVTLSYVSCFHIVRMEWDEDGKQLWGLAKYLPAAGVVIGGFLAASAVLLTSLAAPPLVAGAILTGLWFVFTSGLHLDGLMDAADGIFSHQSPDRMLEIMSDPRVGNFGVIIGVLLLLTKFATITALGTYSLYVVLLVIPAWARFAQVFAIGNYSYLRQQGKGKIWHDSTDFPKDWMISGVVPLLVSAAVCAVCPLCARTLVGVTLCTVLGGIAASRWLSSKLGGQTGDTYGATVEIAEAIGLIAASLLVPRL